jgi:hypothetical protein
LQNSKLISLLKLLSEKEKKQFVDWVKSEFPKGRKGSPSLLESLLSFSPHFSHPALKGPEVWKKAFPDSPFSVSQLKTETKALFDLGKSFLAFKELENRPQELSLLSLAALQQRGEERLLRTEAEVLRRQCDRQQAEDDELRFTRFRLAGLANQQFGFRQKRVVDDSLQQMLDQLDRWYLVQKLRGACELLNRQNIFGTTARFDLLAPLLVGIQEGEYDDTPAIAVYRQVLDMLGDSQQREAFEGLVELLFREGDAFPKEEARALFKYAQNHCIAGINRGEQGYLRDALRLYRHQLDTGLLLLQGEISHTDYTNIAATAVRLGERAWALEFIESYREKLGVEFRESVYRYALARYHYQGKDFREAIQALRSVDFAESFYDLSARILLAKVYFESREHESLAYHIEAFKRYLKRQKHLSSQNRIPYLNFLRILKRLNSVSENWDFLSPQDRAKRISTLNKQLDQVSELAHREWLEAQLRQF